MNQKTINLIVQTVVGLPAWFYLISTDWKLALAIGAVMFSNNLMLKGDNL